MQLRLDIRDLAEDDQRVDELRMKLSRELRCMDLLVEVPPAAAGPAGARGDFVPLGTLLVAIADSHALGAVLNQIRMWLGRASPCGRVKVTLGDDTIEIDATQTERDALLAAFLRRHGDGDKS